MKKLLALILSLALTVGAAFAEIDVGSLSDQELIILKKEIESEYDKRFGECEYLCQGTYLCGTDIPEGRYLFVCRLIANCYTNLCDITILAPDGSRVSSLSLIEGAQCVFTIESGYSLSVRNGEGFLYIAKPLFQ